jgi:4-amino-4-deoxy-L-arabinose transferase-like glycosyltransferase
MAHITTLPIRGVRYKWAGLIGSCSGRIGSRRLLAAGVVLLVGVLASWNLAVAPPTWYDEGVNLQGARNLANSGQYGLVYDDGLRPFDLQLTTGPTVLAPVAATFRVFGVGLEQGRLVMVAYTLLAALGLYTVGRVLYGPTVGLLAVLVLCATNQAGPADTRAVVGEVAALAYLFWGVCLFAVARVTGRVSLHILAGGLFGLAVLTKGQFGLLMPGLAGVWLITRRQPGGFPVQHLFVVLVALLTPVVGWQVYQLVVLQPEGFIAHLRDQSAAVAVSTNAPLLSKTLSGVRYLLSSHMAILGLVALVYIWHGAVGRGWRREPAEKLVLPAFATAWLAWYLGMSMAWARYAIPLVTTCCLFVAVLIRDLGAGFRSSQRPGGGFGRLRLLADPLGTALLLVLAVPIVSGIALQMIALARPPEPSAQLMAALVTRDVAPEASTESLEWELDVLTRHAFHHPPPFVPAVPYDVPADTTYLVDGPMSKWTGLYRRELEKAEYRRIASAGVYDLYRRESPPQAAGCC